MIKNFARFVKITRGSCHEQINYYFYLKSYCNLVKLLAQPKLLSLYCNFEAKDKFSLTAHNSSLTHGLNFHC